MRKNFRNGLAGLVLLGASAGLGGCAHSSDTAALGILGMGLGAGAGSPGVFYAGAGATTYAAGQAQGSRNYSRGFPVQQKEYVELSNDEQKTKILPDRKISHQEAMRFMRIQGASPEKIAIAEETNVAYDPSFGGTGSFICNYGQDLNHNGKIDCEELFGRGGPLVEGDPILLSMGCEKEPGQVVYRLFDISGSKIDEVMGSRSTRVAYNHTDLLQYPKRDEPVRRELKLVAGRYRATLHSGNDLITTREFTIAPKEQRMAVADKDNN